MSKTKTMMDLTPEQRSARMSEIRKLRKSPGYFATLGKEELSAISRRGGLAKTGAWVGKNENQKEEPGPAS